MSLATRIGFSKGSAHLGLITFNREARLRLAFNEWDHQNLEYVKNILKNERRDWMTRIGLAFQTADMKLFTQEGNEDNKAKALIIFTDGKNKAREPVDYMPHVEALKV